MSVVDLQELAVLRLFTSPVRQLCTFLRRNDIAHPPPKSSREVISFVWPRSAPPPLVCHLCGLEDAADSLTRCLLPHVWGDHEEPDPLPWCGYFHRACRRAQWDAEAATNPARAWVRQWKEAQGKCTGLVTATKGGKPTPCPKTTQNTHHSEFDLDHIKPEEKAFCVGLLCAVSDHPAFNLAFLQAEAQKCRLLCKTCHYNHTGVQWGDQLVFRGLRNKALAAGVLEPYTIPAPQQQELRADIVKEAVSHHREIVLLREQNTRRSLEERRVGAEAEAKRRKLDA